MKCVKYRLLFSDYQEGALDKKLSSEIKSHLAGCSKCRKELINLNKIDTLTKELPCYTPSTEILLKIKSAIYGRVGSARKTEFGPVMDIAELAEFLRVDPETIGQYLEDIPSFELGGKLLFRRQSVEDWIARREKGLGSEIVESRLNRILHLQEQEGGKVWKIKI